MTTPKATEQKYHLAEYNGRIFVTSHAEGLCEVNIGNADELKDLTTPRLIPLIDCLALDSPPKQA